MRIHSAALERLATSEFTTEKICAIFKTLELAARDGLGAEIRLNYQDDRDHVTQVDLIPVIIFSLQQAKCPNVIS